MRLKKIWISKYKNLNDFTLDLGGKSFLDVFVGKNGSGKSNLLEAIVEIFNFLYEPNNTESMAGFDFNLTVEFDGIDTVIEHASGKIKINAKDVKKIDSKYLPEKVILYYSGHNGTVANIVEKYESAFKGKIKRAKLEDARSIISIGSDYKQILLSVILLQSNQNKAKKYILEKLRIKEVAPWFKLILKKPFYTSNDIETDEGESRFWGAEGIVRDFIDKLLNCSYEDKSGKARTEGFVHSDQKYHLYFDISKIQAEFIDYSLLDFFNQLDNLKTLEMIEEISIPITLDKKDDANIAFFSDGQFQSVYMYAVAEIFKGKNCLTLLDEPDAFLHPEWQFSFISQVGDIADDATKSNHLIMSSHSASTVSRVDDNVIRLFDFDGASVKTSQVSKGEIIHSLSAGLISFSEGEAHLSINHVLSNTGNQPVLFTEGITDEIILETAWNKLYLGKVRNFVIQNAFDRTFLRNLFSRDELRQNFPNRKMFALFDFDEAYNDWNGLKEKTRLNTDPFKGLVKQLLYDSHYALLLPVPNIESIKKQVLRENNTPWEGTNCHLSMEHLFFSDDLLDKHFRKSPITGGGELIEFVGEKATFAKDIVPTFPPNKFEIFRPIFEFVMAKSGLK